MPSKTPGKKATQPSEELAAVVGGPAPLSRSETVSKVWDYIKGHNLQNPENRNAGSSVVTS
jgi:upstream activation factor subunit UAF30